MNISFQKSFFALGFAILIFAVLILAKTVLIPLGLALLLSFILFPLHKKLLQWGVGNIAGALLSILSLALVIMGALTFFSAEIISLSDEVSKFGDKLMNLFVDLISYINQNISFINNLNEEELLNTAKERIKNSAGGLLGETFSSSTSFLAGLFTTIIYTFLLLIYRDGLVNAFMKFAPKKKKEQFFNMLKKIQQVGQKYLSGMLILIAVLGLANSIGLWIIGIDSPFLFGFFAATLSLIPYIGTTLGATIPVLYAFMSQDELWVPIAVAIMFWFIQLLESNFLSPKIVGSSVNVNAFAAILSLIIGASVWGIAGMVLFLPFAAMLKVVFQEYEELKPIALLISESNFRSQEQKKKTPSWLKKLIPKKKS